MRYNVAQLLKGPTGMLRRYSLSEDIRRLDPGLEPVQPLQGVVNLMRTSQGILVTGQARTVLRVLCRRCLEPCHMEAEIQLEDEFHPVVRIDEAPLDEVPEEDYDEALLIDEHHILDLSELVRQALWLTGPTDALCEPDCAGLCPVCGGNRNLAECRCIPAEIDPRWAALQALLSDQIESTEGSE